MIYKVEVFEDFDHRPTLAQLNAMNELADASPNAEIQMKSLPSGKVRVVMTWTEIRSVDK